MPDVKQAIEGTSIISEEEIEAIDKVIPLEETESFLSGYFESAASSEDEDG